MPLWGLGSAFGRCWVGNSAGRERRLAWVAAAPLWGNGGKKGGYRRPRSDRDTQTSVIDARFVFLSPPSGLTSMMWAFQTQLPLPASHLKGAVQAFPENIKAGLLSSSPLHQVALFLRISAPWLRIAYDGDLWTSIRAAFSQSCWISRARGHIKQHILHFTDMLRPLAVG